MMETKLDRSREPISVDPAPRSTGTVVGLILWRGGVYFTSGYLAFVGARWILIVLLSFGVPARLLLAASLAGGGALLILVSLIVERVQDAHAESELRDLY